MSSSTDVPRSPAPMDGLTDGLLDRMAADLVGVPGVVGVALGGSRARGTHQPGSDVDLGVYYRRDLLDLAALGDAGARWHDAGGVEVTGPRGWGPWVDGGAWLVVDGVHVDWILRDVRRVEEQCVRALAGEFTFHPQPGHPLGFLDVSYAGEVATCRPLADPDGVLAGLRSQVSEYPTALREGMLRDLWRAGFLADAAAKAVGKGDVAYVALCAATSLMVCAHAWYAEAGVWVTNEKGLVTGVARLGLDTHDFSDRANRLLGRLGTGEPELAASVAALRDLVDETRQALRPAA